jgi:hypothetical protein
MCFSIGVTAKGIRHRGCKTARQPDIFAGFLATAFLRPTPSILFYFRRRFLGPAKTHRVAHRSG